MLSCGASYSLRLHRCTLDAQSEHLLHSTRPPTPPTFLSASQNASAVAGACGAAPPATLAELLARDMLAPLGTRCMLAPLGARLSGSASAPVAGSRRGALRLWPSDRSASYS